MLKILEILEIRDCNKYSQVCYNYRNIRNKND
jgi:hypothetical protein